MMLRQGLAIVTIVTIGLALVPQYASADWREDWNRFWTEFERDRQRNEAWPQPFLHRDQSVVRSVFSPMLAAGWRTEQTLTDHHFDPETNVLNTAGIMKVQSILRNVPVSQRSLFVYAGFDPDVTGTRMNALRDQLSQWMPEDQFPAIVSTIERPRGMSGSHADAINQKWSDAIPNPVLPASGGSSGGGGGGN